MDEYNYQLVYDAASALLEASTTSSLNFKKFTKRKSRVITNKDELEKLISITHKQASEKSTIMDLLGNFGDGPKYNPYDIIEVPANSFGGLSKSKDPYDIKEAESSSKKTNKNRFTTTVGLWIFNKCFIEPLSDILGYINHPVTMDEYEDINKVISYALLEDKISVRQLKNFIINSQIFMSCCSAIAPSHTETIFSMEEQIAKKKAELIKKYQKELDESNLVVMKQIENELIDYAKDLLDGDESRDMYDSGARASYGNNFKNMYIMRSGIKGTDNSVKIVTSSYIEGVDAKDFVAVNDGAVGGPFDRSRRTASGGYLERQLLGATSHLKILTSDMINNNTTTTGSNTNINTGMNMYTNDKSNYTGYGVYNGYGSNDNNNNDSSNSAEVFSTTDASNDMVKEIKKYAKINLVSKLVDCGTKDYIKVGLTKKNVKDWYYSYMISSNGRLIELTPDIADKYIGQEVKMRYSALCKCGGGYICESCMGSLFKRIGIQNVGTLSTILGSSLKNKLMKRFHDNTISIYEIDIIKAFELD